MKLLKKSFETFKNHFTKIFFIEMLFFSLTTLTIILTKLKLKAYILQIQLLSPLVNELSQQETINLAALQSTMSLIKPLLSKYLLLQYLIAPLIIFILFILTQGFIWQTLSNQKFNLKYYFKFTIISIPLLLISSYLFYQTITLLSLFLSSDISSFQLQSKIFLILIILGLLIAYLTFLAYSLLNKQSLKELIQQIFNLKFKKFINFFLVYLLFLGVLFTLFLTYFGFLISFLSYSYANLIKWFIPFLFILIVAIYFKSLFKLILEKN